MLYQQRVSHNGEQNTNNLLSLMFVLDYGNLLYIHGFNTSCCYCFHVSYFTYHCVLSQVITVHLSLPSYLTCLQHENQLLRQISGNRDLLYQIKFGQTRFHSYILRFCSNLLSCFNNRNKLPEMSLFSLMHLFHLPL